MNEALGYAASLAVLATFLMQSMVSLRLVAILSNVLFVCYGYLAHIHPVLLLHSALLPINLVRLANLQGGSAFEAGQRVRPMLTEKARQVALFFLGFAAGTLGLRALLQTVFAILERCNRSPV